MSVFKSAFVVMLYEVMLVVVGVNTGVKAGAKYGANSITLFLRVAASRLFPNIRMLDMVYSFVKEHVLTFLQLKINFIV